jgi:hypothetical protein
MLIGANAAEFNIFNNGLIFEHPSKLETHNLNPA